MAKKQMNNSQRSTAESVDVMKKQEHMSSNIQSNKSVAVADKPSVKQTREHTAPTYEQIAERAKKLWRERGCPPNQDEKNWYDAENQLKRELGSH
jgi:hypothetical protein